MGTVKERMVFVLQDRKGQSVPNEWSWGTRPGTGIAKSGREQMALVLS